MVDIERTEKTILHEETDKNKNSGNGAPCLIALTGNSVGKLFKLIGSQWIIGRGKTVEITIDDASISRAHAKLFLDKGSLFIQDMGSTNGTFINGEKITIAKVKDGDKIKLGDTCILKFTYQDEVEENFQKYLYDSATRDHLTKIYNKKYFSERVQSEFTYAVRHEIPLSLIIFDVDHFKKINDSYGHLVGDFVLKSITDLILKIIRKEDIFARYGGEEFVLLLRGINEKQVFIFADRMRKTIANHTFHWQSTILSVTVSVGIATLHRIKYTNHDEMIEAADTYLYQAKRAGRNQVRSLLQEKDE